MDLIVPSLLDGWIRDGTVCSDPRVRVFRHRASLNSGLNYSVWWTPPLQHSPLVVFGVSLTTSEKYGFTELYEPFIMSTSFSPSFWNTIHQLREKGEKRGFVLKFTKNREVLHIIANQGHFRVAWLFFNHRCGLTSCSHSFRRSIAILVF